MEPKRSKRDNRLPPERLPMEILTEIFLRLPLKAILRFRTMCKWMCDSISSRDFIFTHLDRHQRGQQREIEDLLVRSYSGTEEEFAILRGNNTFTKINFPHKSSGGYFPFITECMGMFVVVDFGWSACYLWNPSIRRTVEVPETTIKPTSHHLCTHGLGFDNATKDFKLVQIGEKMGGEKNVQIFKLSTGVWDDKSMIAPLCSFRSLWKDKPVYFSGVIHWLCHEPNDRNSSIICCFDVENEVFSLMVLPKPLKKKQSDYKVLFALEGLLSLVVGPYKPDLIVYVDVWVMKEYEDPESWMRLFCFPGNPIPRSTDSIVKPLWFRRKSEIMWRTKDGSLISYNHASREASFTGITNTSGLFVCEALYASCYRECLVLLEEPSWLKLQRLLND